MSEKKYILISSREHLHRSMADSDFAYEATMNKDGEIELREIKSRYGVHNNPPKSIWAIIGALCPKIFGSKRK